jgi:hypothetical protein
MTTRTLAAMVADGMTASETRGRAFRVIGGDEAVGSTVELLNGATVQTTPSAQRSPFPSDASARRARRVGEHVDIRPEYLSPVGDTVTFATLVNRGETPRRCGLVGSSSCRTRGRGSATRPRSRPTWVRRSRAVRHD